MATTNTTTNLVTQDQRDAYALQRKNGTPLDKIKVYARLPDIQERFVNMLGQREGRAYLESVIIAVANSEALQECSPKSIMISAMRAASLHLSVDPTLKQAHIVPFGKEATLIVDYHGLCTLTESTWQYQNPPNVSEVFEGETVKVNRFTGEVEITGTPTEPKTIKGWCGYFRLRNGVERWLYMTNEECDAHGKKYSKAFNSSRSGWNTDREKMRRKTVLRNLVSRWAPFSASVDHILKQDDDEPIEGEAFDLPDDTNIKYTAPASRPPTDLLRELGYEDREAGDEDKTNDGLVVDDERKAEATTSENKRMQQQPPSETFAANVALKGRVLGFCVRKPAATASDKDRKVLASAVDTIFGGEKTMRYELFKYLTGEASTQKMQPANVAALLDILEITDFNQAPAPAAITMFRAAHSEVLKAQGQAELGM